MASISKRGRKKRGSGRQPKTLDQLNRLYEQQKETIESNPLTTKSGEKEQWKRCLDKESFGGRCYCPALVVSSFGRIWGLDNGENGGLMHPFMSRSGADRRDGYKKIEVAEAGNARKVNPIKSVYVHRLVANYFCDLDHEQRNLMIEKGRARNKDDFDVHHISLNRLLLEDQLLNRWDNLQFLGKKHHRALHKLLTNMASGNKEKAQKTLRSFNKRYGQIFEDGTLEKIGITSYAHRKNKWNRLAFIYRKASEKELKEDQEILKGLPEGTRIDPIREEILTRPVSPKSGDMPNDKQQEP